MIRKIENTIALLLVLLLATLPFILRFFQGVLHIPIPDADVALVHFVFLFSCFAGLITWKEERHLSLASFLNRLPEKAQKVTEEIKTLLTTCILTSLFIVSLCQLVNPTLFDSNFWHIPLRFLFLFLPLCYFGIVINIASKKKCIIGFVLGILLSVFISAGPLAGILYYVFNVENVPFLYSVNDWWILFSAKIALPLILLLVLFAFLGVPLFVVLAGIAYILFSKSGGYVDVLPLETYRIFTDRNIAAVPLFTIAGYILAQSSAGKRYVSVFRSLLSPFRGGSVIAAVIVTTFFSTFTGVSGVTILALGPLLSVVLTGSGYEKEKAESLVTSSGAIGLLFPPSAAIIMYATVNYFSLDVFDLFKGAILPGVLMALSMIGAGIFFDRQKERPKFVFSEAKASILNCIPELLLPFFICFFYFRGFFDLFEIAAFALVYSLILSVFVRKDFSFQKAYEVIIGSIPVSGGVIFILGAASGVSYFMLDANVPYLLTEFITQYVTNKYLFLILMNFVLLIVGCLMDMFSAILIVSPLLLPLSESFGITAVHAAVIFLMNLSIGFLTPPVGMDLFISSYTFSKPLSRVIKGILPFLVVQLCVLLVVTYVPWFTSVLVR